MTIILVPGFMADADLWSDVSPQLQSHAPVIHADLSQDTSIAEMAARALGTAQGSFHLVGFSMGGYVAREMARLAPDRIESLTLVATSARGDTPEQARRKSASASKLSSVRQNFTGLSHFSIASSLGPSRAADETLIERIRQMGVRLGGETFIRQLTIKRDGDVDRLAKIRCATLVIAGAQDRLRSLEESAELQAGIRGAQLRVIEDCGHMIPLEAPQALLSLLLPWIQLESTKLP